MLHCSSSHMLLWISCAKFYVFLIWFSNFFSNNVVLIKDQLILIYYEKVGLKEDRSKWKGHQTWVICYEFCKRCTLVIILLKSHKLYNLSTSIFFQFNFGEFIFVIFLVFDWDRLLDSGGRERKLSLTPIQAIKIDYIYVKWFHLTMRVHIMCFCTFKVCGKKISELELILVFSSHKQVYHGFYGVFYRCFG